MIHAIMWMNAEQKKEVIQTHKVTHEIFRLGKSTETKSKLVVAGVRENKEQEMIANG